MTALPACETSCPDITVTAFCHFGERHSDAKKRPLRNFQQRLTNASADSFSAKIKASRTQFRGVTDIKFFMYRLAKLYS